MPLASSVDVKCLTTREIEQRRWGGRRETVHARLAMAAMTASELSWCEQRFWDRKMLEGEARQGE